MNALGALLSGDRPSVAVSVTEAGPVPDADLIELRIDRFASSTSVDDVVATIRLPTLATVRSRAEGGAWTADEDARKKLFLDVIPLVDGIDIELSSAEIRDEVVDAAHAHGKVVVISFHDFERTPPAAELQRIVDAAKAAGATAVKISTMATSMADVRTLAALTLANPDTSMITIAMGATGALSRVFFPALGSRITYCYVGAEGAPGQLELREATALLRRFYPDTVLKAEPVDS